MKHNFGVGDMVVCVSDSGQCRKNKKWIIAGDIYTVTWMGPDDLFPDRIVVEVAGVYRNCCLGPRFFAERFRPVRKTDISIFEKCLLVKSKELEPV